MSERGSFTSEYFYNLHDYEIIRKALDKKGKYLCIAPPAVWECDQYDGTHDTFEMPIVQGKVGELAMNCEYLTIMEAISGVRTKEEVNIVVMCDGGSIMLVTKEPEGATHARCLIPDEDNEYGVEINAREQEAII